ncbi:MAG: exodeoxyribonuclease VII small subunit [Planctomycetota bacterium]
MATSKKKSETATYAQMSGELEEILDEIESGEIDLDVLSDKVERAALLLTQCRKKLAATETKVKKVTTELQEALEDGEGNAGDGGGRSKSSDEEHAGE